MKTPAYIMGVLDALVKAGAVSPAYAAGAASVLTKQAGLFGNTAAQNYHDNYMRWRAQNPGQQLTPDAARQLALDSRNWYEKAFSPAAGWGTWASNRAGKWTAGIRSVFGASNVPTSAEYDRAYKDEVNKQLKPYIDTHYNLDAQAAGATQDAFVRDADFRVLDAKRTMSDLARENAGLTEDYADQYRTEGGTAAIRGGPYKPKYDTKSTKPPEQYGQNLPKSYGANKSMFYRVGYTNPLARK